MVSSWSRSRRVRWWYQFATVRATITDATLAALPFILDPSQDGYHDTAADIAPVGHLSRPSLLVSMA
jgi:hypothetical protein